MRIRLGVLLGQVAGGCLGGMLVISGLWHCQSGRDREIPRANRHDKKADKMLTGIGVEGHFRHVADKPGSKSGPRGREAKYLILRHLRSAGRKSNARRGCEEEEEIG